MINANKNNHNDRIVITGIGVVSPIGIGKEEFWTALREGRSGIKPVTLFDTQTTCSKLAGEIADFRPEEIIGSKGLRNLDRTTKLALCAGQLALNDAQLIIDNANSDRIGIVLGSTMGSVWSISEFDKASIRDGFRSINPAVFPNTVMNSPASQLSIRFKIQGFNSTISTGFTSSIDSLQYAKFFLEMRRADFVLVGGVEELCEQTYKGFGKLDFLSSVDQKKNEISAPFDRRRNGAVLGEGAVIFILERLENALLRNAKIYASVAGAGFSFDKHSFHRYDLKARGAKRAINRALNNSNTKIEEIDYISSSANSTLDGDIAEFRALQSTLGGKKKLVASSCKSMIGETYSASGAFQVASALFTYETGFLSPTINFERQDKRCQIDCVPNKSRVSKPGKILVSNFGPNGQNAALVLQRQDLCKG